MTATPTNTALTNLRPGDKLDKFEIVQQIGLGGTSVVWKGYDRLLDRHVAIKQIVREAGAAIEHEAFAEKLRADAALQKKASQAHKNLVKVFDLIEEPRGLFLVMEYVDGPSLAQYLVKNPQPMDQRQALGLIGATALALGALHQQGVIHRDLKPSNILLPAAGGLKVADFGQAALMGDQDVLALGSVRYMAPELFGEGAADGRADIYALGMIAYELLAGKDRFNEAFKVVLRDQRNQALRWMKWHTNPRTAAPALNQINPAVPKKLSDLVARMMEKDREQRVPSAEELLAAIRRHFAGRSGEEAGEPGGDAARRAAMAAAVPVEPTAPLPKRSRLPLILGGCLVVLVLLVLGIKGYQSHQRGLQVEARRNQALNEFKAARKDLNDATDLADAPEPPYDENMTDEQWAQREKKLKDQIEQEKTLFTQATEGFDRLAGAWSNDAELGAPSAARSLYAQALLAFVEGRYDDSLAKFDQADKLNVLDRDLIQKRKYRATDRKTAAELLAAINSEIEKGNLDAARGRVGKAREFRRKLTAEQLREIDALANYIEGRQQENDLQAILTAAQALHKSPNLDDRNKAEKSLVDAFARYKDARYKNQLDQWKHEQYVEGVVNKFKVAEGADDLPGALAAINELLNPRQVSTADLERCGLTKEGLVEGQKKLQSRDFYQRGKAEEAQGNIQNAIDLYRRAEATSPNPEAKDALSRLKVVGDKQAFVRQGDTAAAGGQYAEAITFYKQALDLGGADQEVARKLKDSQVKLLLQQAQSAQVEGKLPEARDLYQKVLQVEPGNAVATKGIKDLDTVERYQTLLRAGDAYRAQGKYPEAKSEFRKAQGIMGTDEVKQRLDDVEYLDLLAKVRAAIRAGNWESAKALALTAAKAKVTKDLSDILEEIRNHEKQTPPPPAP